MPRQPACIGLADVPDPEREDEAVEPDAAARLDGREQIADRCFAVTLAILQFMRLRACRAPPA